MQLSCRLIGVEMEIKIICKDDGFWLSLDGKKKALINLGSHGKIVTSALEEAV